MNQPPLSDPNYNPNTAPLQYAQPPITGDNTGGVIPFKNPSALASYYIGLFSLLPILAYVMGPAAIFLGIKGLKYAKQHPVVKGQVHAWVGILCGALWTVLYYGFTLMMILAMMTRPRA